MKTELRRAYWPTKTWQVTDPISVDMDGSKLVDLEQTNERLVVGILDLDTGHFDLLHKLPLVSVNRIQLVHHVVLVDMGG